MSGKTKAELLAEIESLRHQLEVKDDYIGTPEDLLDAETRDTNALRTSHDVGVKRYVAANKGRVIAELKSIANRQLLFGRFLAHRGDSVRAMSCLSTSKTCRGRRAMSRIGLTPDLKTFLIRLSCSSDRPRPPIMASSRHGSGQDDS